MLFKLLYCNKVFIMLDFIDSELPKEGDTVVVGMSGGVDSTLVTMLLKEKGCKVIGVTMSLWDGRIPEGIDLDTLPASCYGPSEVTNIEECKKFCKEQNIDYYVVDVKQKYHDEILEYFKYEYRNGRTPNPCIKCNWKIKFGALLKGIEDLGIKYDYFCTGHYAKIVQPKNGIFGTDEKPYMICAATDKAKDQTYFLYRVSSEVLKKVRFPLASITKQEVFEIAKKMNLSAANRQESQDFVPQEYFDMLFSDKPGIEGNIVDLDGKVLGRHKGIEHYTIGQRRGLGVAVSYPVYVHSIDPVKNIVVLSKNEDLNADGLIADDFVWAGNIEPKEKITAKVKIRLASKSVNATIEKYIPQSDEEKFTGTAWKIIFDEPQRAIAPGQSVVLYDNEIIIGGGIINKTIR